MKTYITGPRSPIRTPILLVLGLILCIFTLITAPVYGNQNIPIETNLLASSTESTDAMTRRIFAKSYFSLGVGKNFPVDKSARRFQPGYYHPIFGYRYVLDDSWLLGISAQFKVLKDRETSDVVSLFSIEEQSQRIIRLYHPFYLLVGAKFMYLLPANKPRLPIQKNSDFAIEMGGGGTISILYLVSKSAFFGAYIDQWRGTKTTKLQAIETGFFVAVALGPVKE